MAPLASRGRSALRRRNTRSSVSTTKGWSAMFVTNTPEPSSIDAYTAISSSLRTATVLNRSVRWAITSAAPKRV